jgi:hypothetical protein
MGTQGKAKKRTHTTTNNLIETPESQKNNQSITNNNPPSLINPTKPKLSFKPNFKKKIPIPQ